MTEDATIRRGVRNARYTTVPNHVFEDDRLSMEARWLLGYLLSKPDDWTVRLGDIRKKGGCGRDKARAMVAELVKAGYAEKEPARKDGKFNGLCLVIYDEPRDVSGAETPSVASLPQPEKPSTVLPSPVNPPLVKTEELATPEGPERETRERELGDKNPETLAPEERPGTAAFKNRVLLFCNGRGFAAGPWPNWDVGASQDWIAARMAPLTVEERAEAERWRDPYLLDVAARKQTPLSVGSFLSGKLWTGLDPAILDRAERQRQRQLQPAERAQPEGWAGCLGPVGMAKLFADLLAGPPAGAAEPGTLWFESQLRNEWPAVHQWKLLQQSRGGTVFGERWHALKGAMEAAPAETETHAAWKAVFAERGWPWLSSFDGHPVLWAPKGGPAGLDHFEQLVAEGGQAARPSAGPASSASGAGRRQSEKTS